MEDSSVLPNVDIDNGWFPLIQQEFLPKVSAVNFPGDLSFNLYRLHSVNSCCFENLITRLLGCISPLLHNYFERETHYIVSSQNFISFIQRNMQGKHIYLPNKDIVQIPFSTTISCVTPNIHSSPIPQMRANISKTPTSNCREWTLQLLSMKGSPRLLIEHHSRNPNCTVNLQ